MPTPEAFAYQPTPKGIAVFLANPTGTRLGEIRLHFTADGVKLPHPVYEAVYPKWAGRKPSYHRTKIEAAGALAKAHCDGLIPTTGE